jgi:hypothetical protein
MRIGRENDNKGTIKAHLKRWKPDSELIRFEMIVTEVTN